MLAWTAPLSLVLFLEPAPPDPPSSDASELTELRRAVERNPQDAEAWARLGSRWLRDGEIEAAVPPLRRALSLNPEVDDARYNLAYALRELGRPEEAAAAYRAYLERVPADADAWYALAETEVALGRDAAAADAFERYASVERRSDRARWVERARERARALRARSTDPAAPPTPAPNESEPGPPALRSALVSLEAQDYAGALRILRAEVPTPRDGFALAAYGSAHLGLGALEPARDYFERAAAVLRGPARAGARIGQAEALWGLGRRAEARDLFRDVWATDPDTIPGPWRELASRRIRP